MYHNYKLNMEQTESTTPDYIFDPSDQAGWSQYLDQHGYCVLRATLDTATVESVTAMVWEDMTKLYDVDKADPSSWGSIPTGAAGIVSKGLPQTQGPWTVRSSEAIRQAFSAIWNTDELLVSMDSLLCWLPWDFNPQWEPFSGKLSLNGQADDSFFNSSIM